MERAMPIRRRTRYRVCWPMRYGTDRFFAEGTVLDVTEAGWRLAGPVPVQPGTSLWIQVCLPDSPVEATTVRGKVLWTKGLEYALSIDGPPSWLEAFLGQALSRWLYPSVPETEPACRSTMFDPSTHQLGQRKHRSRAPWQCRSLHPKNGDR
jgi:hypothetical protein